MKANYFQQKAKKTDTLSMVWYILMLSHVPGSYEKFHTMEPINSILASRVKCQWGSIFYSNNDKFIFHQKSILRIFLLNLGLN